MIWLWIGLGILASVPVLLILGGLVLYVRLWIKYLPFVVRIFQEVPIFIIPRGQPAPEAEDVRFPTAGGLTLAGCYFHAKGPRRGVILFGLEYGSNRWSCTQYCDHLLDAGFDVFAFEFRSQGDSDAQPGYKPLQWLTRYEVEDMRAAFAYLKGRPDADPRGFGLFGISKGGSAGLLAAAGEPFVRCVVTDGAFGTHSTMVPYMRKWISIYSRWYFLQKTVPTWYYGLFTRPAMRRVAKINHCRYVHLEPAMPRLAPRPLLMIHGAADTYIKPEMARTLFELARQPKEFWLVEGARHNQALQVAGDEYRRRVRDFFQTHLAPNDERRPGNDRPDGSHQARDGGTASVPACPPVRDPRSALLDAR